MTAICEPRPRTEIWIASHLDTEQRREWLMESLPRLAQIADVRVSISGPNPPASSGQKIRVTHTGTTALAQFDHLARLYDCAKMESSPPRPSSLWMMTTFFFRARSMRWKMLNAEWECISRTSPQKTSRTYSWTVRKRLWPSSLQMTSQRRLRKRRLRKIPTQSRAKATS